MPTMFAYPFLSTCNLRTYLIKNSALFPNEYPPATQKWSPIIREAADARPVGGFMMPNVSQLSSLTDSPQLAPVCRKTVLLQENVKQK